MINKQYINSLKRLHKKLRGSTVEYNLDAYRQFVIQIRNYHNSIKNESDQSIKKSILSIKKQICAEENQDIFMVQIYGYIIEIIHRTLKVNPFDVQLIGAIAMHQGKITQMNTGEGKTLTAVFPATLNALIGKGVHILTFNDYLAKRDADWMKQVYEFFGLTVNYIQEGMSISRRQKAYGADITYLSAKEAGFDYLRDSLCYDQNNIVHRPLNFAIIDEADSILIDEARIPLVIAGSDNSKISALHQYTKIAQKLEKDIHYEFDEYARNINITDKGQRAVEKELKCGNLYADKNLDKLTGLNCALHAEYLLQRDVDYIVRNNKIELVDEYTGRVADKRRWPDGLQAAIEAKENINIQTRGKILNSVTLQHFLQLYPTICGMTATAEIAEEEFKRFYNLDIIVIPPNQQNRRIDYPNKIFLTKEIKHFKLLDEIIKVHETGRPILVGTASVDESEKIASLLNNKGIHCSVLNAKQDAHEAKIIAEAGKIGAVTISTNMAGRGVDIKLGGSDEEEKDRVIELGGLYVIGTDLHESRRIDQQLRGRAGRQGDPGSSQFFISIKDDLLIKYRLDELIPSDLLENLTTTEIDNIIIRREVERIQRICEGQNLEIKKTLTKYSDLIEKQRMILIEKRRCVLNNENAISLYGYNKSKNYTKIAKKLGQKPADKLVCQIGLYHIDEFWSEYLADIMDIRESIHLKRIGGEDPYIEFQKLAIEIFDERFNVIDRNIKKTINKILVDNKNSNLDELGIRAPSATWTYLVNDNPFENNFGIQLIGDTGLQVAAGIFGPLVALEYYFRRKKINKLSNLK